jgi:predicted cupin superfamily sugar epimerase
MILKIIINKKENVKMILFGTKGNPEDTGKKPQELRPVKQEIQSIIERLGLVPLEPEGGYFRQTFKSNRETPIQWSSTEKPGPRALMTAIYYLITPENFSAFHRVKGTEIFHFYAGDSVALTLIHLDGHHEAINLGSQVNQGELAQAIVAPGTWQALRIQEGGIHGYSLLGATVSPGFEYCDFEMAGEAELIREFPRHAQLIRENCRS